MSVGDPTEGGRLLRLLFLRLRPVPTQADRQVTRTVGWADTAGVCGAVFAALCCMGAPVIVSALAAIGLSWLRQDAILWPLMVVSLAIAIWGLALDRRVHGATGPLMIAVFSALGLVAGVIFVHGPPARVLINTSALALVLATAWNVWLRKARPAVAAVEPGR